MAAFEGWHCGGCAGEHFKEKVKASAFGGSSGIVVRFVFAFETEDSDRRSYVGGVGVEVGNVGKAEGVGL